MVRVYNAESGETIRRFDNCPWGTWFLLCVLSPFVPKGLRVLKGRTQDPKGALRGKKYVSR